MKFSSKLSMNLKLILVSVFFILHALSCKTDVINSRVYIWGTLVDKNTKLPIRFQTINGRAYLEKTGVFGDAVKVGNEFLLKTDSIGKFRTSFIQSSRYKEIIFFNEKNLPFFNTEEQNDLGILEYE
ncbi:MAG: hypothetical protein E6Q89_02505 [Bacteroidia bacterium]|nr:MAG: hypothetical protein E6Q89_02505 [Bacteroidia bacterium]